MKRLQVSSWLILSVLVLFSAQVAANAFQRQADMERELSVTILGGSQFINGGFAEGDFLLEAQSRTHRLFISDPLMFGSVERLNGNPARDGFAGNPARGLFMQIAPLRR